MTALVTKLLDGDLCCTLTGRVVMNCTFGIEGVTTVGLRVMDMAAILKKFILHQGNSPSYKGW